MSGRSGEREAEARADVSREYRRLARDYERRWATYLRDTTEMTADALGPASGERVLDLGSGTGWLLRELGDRVPGVELHGLELSPAMLRVAGEEPRRGSAGAHLIHGRGESLPYRDEVFDAVVSSSVLHYVPEPRRVLREARRVLRPGGRFVLTDWCRDYLAMKVLDAWLRRRDPAHVRTLSAASAMAMMADEGFRPRSPERRRVSPLWGIMTVVALR